MTKYLSIAILITGFLVGNAYGEDLIADLHFDDGSVLHNIKIQNNVVHFKHEGDSYDFNYRDLKSISFDVQPGTSDVTRCARHNDWYTYGRPELKKCGTIGKEAIVTLKIKTKIGVEAIDRFSTGGDINDRGCSGIPYRYDTTQYSDSGLAHEVNVKVISKLTGKKITRTYGITNITTRSFLATFYVLAVDADFEEASPFGCIFHKGNKKAIKSIVFKDGKKIEGIKK